MGVYIEPIGNYLIRAAFVSSKIDHQAEAF
jgi:hypothetical protein